MAEFGLEDVEALSDAIIERSERAMREAIRALPNGVYTNESLSDGFDEPIRIRVTVTIAVEDIAIDFDGSSLIFATGWPTIGDAFVTLSSMISRFSWRRLSMLTTRWSGTSCSISERIDCAALTVKRTPSASKC